MGRPRVLAIIPARGGSKRVPRKNIRNFLGKPLLSYTIEVALNSCLVDRVLVSTEDEAIALVAKQYGAEVPFLRPKELAGDIVADYPVVEYALNWAMEREKWNVDMLVFLRPTSIFRQPKDIDALINKLLTYDYDSVRSLSKAVYSPYWMKKIVGDTIIPFVQSECEYTYIRSQDLPKVYQCNGTVEAIKTKTILEKKSLYGDKIGYVERLDDFATIDIDTEKDFLLAEAAYKIWIEGERRKA